MQAYVNSKIYLIPRKTKEIGRRVKLCKIDNVKTAKMWYSYSIRVPRQCRLRRACGTGEWYISSQRQIMTLGIYICIVCAIVRTVVQWKRGSSNSVPPGFFSDDVVGDAVPFRPASGGLCVRRCHLVDLDEYLQEYEYVDR